MEVQLETRPEIRVAALAHTGPYNTIGSAFDRLDELAGPAGMLTNADARLIAIYYDDPESTPAQALRSAAGLTVARDAVLPHPFHEVRLPAGRWARAIHRGSYEGLGDAWQRLLGQWLPNSGLRMGVGECYELYLNHPGNAREEDLETLLYVPIAS
jgi:AraC family transcriptional regulator